jgi:hypothetical protein
LCWRDALFNKPILRCLYRKDYFTINQTADPLDVFADLILVQSPIFW